MGEEKPKSFSNKISSVYIIKNLCCRISDQYFCKKIDVSFWQLTPSSNNTINVPV